MSTPIDHRRIVCEFLIAAGVCGAAYYFVPAAVRTKIAGVRQEIAQAQARDADRAGLGALTDTQVADLNRSTAERAAELRARSMPAHDETTMFARVSELASANGVEIEQLNPVKLQSSSLPPGVQPGSPAAAAAAPPADGPPPPKDERVGYSLVATGDYANLAGFIRGLTHDIGFAIVRNVRIEQTDVHRPNQLRAAIDTEHFAVDLASVKIPGAAVPPSSATASVQPPQSPRE